MRFTFLFAFVTGLILGASSCTPFRGCMDETAENYDINAEEDDGTCQPSIDKIIGDFTFTKMWNDVILNYDSVELGYMRITEANTGDNHFNLMLNGTRIIQGSVSASDIVIEQFTYEDTLWGYTIDRTYTGVGTWLENDTVDMRIELTTKIPMPDNNPPPWPTVPQTYYYYCTKTAD